MKAIIWCSDFALLNNLRVLCGPLRVCVEYQALLSKLPNTHHLLIAPIIAGGGNPYLPGKVRMQLELIDERTFDNGLIHIRYVAKS